MRGSMLSAEKPSTAQCGKRAFSTIEQPSNIRFGSNLALSEQTQPDEDNIADMVKTAEIKILSHEERMLNGSQL